MNASRTVKVQGGKEHVIFAALLNEFHQQYRYHEIDTELIQIPTPDNGNVAIVKASVKGTTQNQEEDRRFSGIGDASPENVGPRIVPHIIRMAETRAKARALRDAVNIGSNEFEDLEGTEPLERGAEAVRRQPRGSEDKSDYHSGSAANEDYEDESFASERLGESQERKELLDELVKNSKKLGFNNQQISKKLETHWLEADMYELEESASRMRMAVENQDRELAERQ